MTVLTIFMFESQLIKSTALGRSSFIGPAPGIFCCAKALGLRTHVDTKVSACRGGGGGGGTMVTGQSDTRITSLCINFIENLNQSRVIYDVYLQNCEGCSSLDHCPQNTPDFCTPILNWTCSYFVVQHNFLVALEITLYYKWKRSRCCNTCSFSLTTWDVLRICCTIFYAYHKTIIHEYLCPITFEHNNDVTIVIKIYWHVAFYKSLIMILVSFLYSKCSRK